MKKAKQVRSQNRLELGRETIRDLTGRDLQRVSGGNEYSVRTCTGEACRPTE